MSSPSTAKTHPSITAIQPRWNAYLNQLIAREISEMTRYYDEVIQWLPRKEESGYLLSRIEAGDKSTIRPDEAFPKLTDEMQRRTAVLLNGTLNHSFDIQELLIDLKKNLSELYKAELSSWR